MFELVINDNDGERVIFASEDKRVVELMRQRHIRSLAVGEASIRNASK